MPTTQIQLDKPMPLPETPYRIERNVPMPIKIERNVPMPAPRGRYPFKLLAIGDSFSIPIAEADRAVGASYIGRQAGDTQARRFTHRQDKVTGTVRFWRIQ